ncbi:ABC transporter ATP-binding protein [Bacteroides mediterraneensis]|uniref:ABC transporter ATP-binding protein n=1 Tax=Bacteroides mediterraneensis TaxID=1841856 RepID=UPI00195EA5F1|nr:ABC transporter ATP-binding protein [Bacteroides mediterraneensis]MBM6781071.1 ATP-binding cassette domain-containing protein [Bacteroides mediterraneensis]
MNESFLEARQVTKRYANHTALEEVSIQVPKGQVFGLLGPNGAGKTTLIRIINRITAPDAGEVWFNGHLSQPQDIYSIGYLPEERGLYKKMKVGEQAIYLAQLKGLSRQEAKKRLTDWFDRFDIMPWWNKKLEELSKGMQQKVQFVITVLHRPPLLIFDEPFSGFDPVNAELLKREILKLKEEGHTIIFSTHNMASVEEICDHIALINHSQVVLQGAVQDIRSQYKSNQYELTVRLDNPLPESDAFEVVDSQVVDAQTVSYKLRKLTSISNSEMLSLIGAQTEIIQFSECIPSMNDIFIRTVEGKI